jgi:ACS family hexuronate transporter-like MFS transporter
MFKNQFRWFIVFLLFFICVINYIDRASLSFAINPIDQEFHFTESQNGLLLGAFGIGYVFSTLMGGILADRYGAKITLTAAALLWSLATFLLSLAQDLSMLIFARVLLGFAEGPIFPCLTRAISDWLSDKERARAFTFGLVSVPISLAISGPIISELMTFTTWRQSYILLGLISLLWIPFWLYFFTNQAKNSKFVSAEEKKMIGATPKDKKAKPMSLKEVLLNKTLIVNNLGYLSYGFYLFFFMTWLPSYLESEYHLSIKKTAFFTVFPWLFAAFMMFVNGSISDKLLAKTNNYRIARTYPILIMQILQALCLVPLIFFEQNFILAMMAICLAIGFTMGANSIYYAVNVDIAQSRSATSLGLMDVFFAIAGFVAPTLTGMVLGYTESYSSIFYSLFGMSIITMIVMFCFHNRNQ